MIRSFRLVIVAAIALAFATHAIAYAAAAERRVALVIGNSTYGQAGSLNSPIKDARLIGEALSALEFTLVGGGPQFDLDKAKFDRVVQEFGNALQNAEVGVIYFAGYGIQVRGRNYLVPIGASPRKEVDVDFQTLDVNLLMRLMEGSGSKLNLILLDASRNSPFSDLTPANGLAKMQGPDGMLISFAAQPGNIALEGSKGGNSPYAIALAQAMRKTALDIGGVFRDVEVAVLNTTNNSQRPWTSALSSIKGDFSFSRAFCEKEKSELGSIEGDLRKLKEFVGRQGCDDVRALAKAKMAAFTDDEKICTDEERIALGCWIGYGERKGRN